MKRSLVVIFAIFILFPKIALAAKTTLYFPSYEKTLETGQIDKYYLLPGITIQRSNQKLHYLIPDHLASTKTIAAKNQKPTYLSYYPFGQLKNPQPANLPAGRQVNNLYTSQKLDSATNLYYCLARYYNPDIAHFISADNAQGPNRFSYVFNNPINNSDPSGNMVDEGGMGSSTLYGGYGLGYYSQTQAERAIETSGQIVKTGSMFIPGAGIYFMAGISGYESFVGKDLISGEKLSPLRRILSGLGMAPAVMRLGKLAIEAEAKLSPPINSFFGRQVIKKYGMYFSKNPAEFFERNLGTYQSKFRTSLGVELRPLPSSGRYRYSFSFRGKDPVLILPGGADSKGEFLTRPFGVMYHEFTHAFQYGGLSSQRAIAKARNPFRYIFHELEANAVSNLFAPQPLSASFSRTTASFMTTPSITSLFRQNLFLYRGYNHFVQTVADYGSLGLQ